MPAKAAFSLADFSSTLIHTKLRKISYTTFLRGLDKMASKLYHLVGKDSNADLVSTCSSFPNLCKESVFSNRQQEQERKMYNNDSATSREKTSRQELQTSKSNIQLTEYLIKR